MYPREKGNFGAFLTDYFARRYSKSLSKIDVEEWWEDLERFSFEQIKSAFRDHRQDEKTGEFAPKTSQILKLLRGKEPQKIFECACWYRKDGLCRNEGAIKVGPDDQNQYLCFEHYEIVRYRHDYELRVVEYYDNLKVLPKKKSPHHIVNLLSKLKG